MSFMMAGYHVDDDDNVNFDADDDLMMMWWWCLQVQLRLDSLVIPIGTHQVIKANRKWWMTTKAMMIMVSDSCFVTLLMFDDGNYCLILIMYFCISPFPLLLKGWTFPNLCVQPSTKSLRNFRWSCFKWFVESPSYALIRWFQGQLNLWWKMHQKSKMMMKYAPKEENDDEICTRRGKW